MNKNNIIKAVDFEKLVAEAKDNSWQCPDIVEGYVNIDGEKIHQKLKKFDISGISFTGSLSIRNFNDPDFLLSIGENCNFLDGLSISGVSVRNINIVGCKSKWIELLRCNSDTAHLLNLDVTNDLDISGLNLKEYLKMVNVNFTGLNLVHMITNDTIQVPKVITNNEAISFQFVLARIPVFVPTSLVKKCF